jgi:UDP-N-acetylglucosamine acyltransferase
LLDARHRAGMTTAIHPSAIVHPGARLAPGVEVGPYSIVGPKVEVGEGSWIGSHVVLDGRTRIGPGNKVFHFASIGAPPQDKKYAGEDTAVEIGARNTIREYVTINRGTALDVGVTRVGDDNWIMAYVHVAHDCQIGSHTIFANACQLAGHVTVGDWAIFGATTLVHQFVHIGAHAFTGMGTYLPQDLPPFVTAAGNMAQPYGINSEGLKRRGFTPETINGLKRAYRTLYRKGLSLEEARRELEGQVAGCEEVRELLDFLSKSKRGIIR